jgi:hypothetical protein
VTPTLTTVQRWALELAEQHGWGVQVEAPGARVVLRQGHPARALVLYLGGAARKADERAARAEQSGDARPP